MTDRDSDLYTPQQLRELDRLAAASPAIGVSLELMERAGAAAYRLLRRRWPAARRLAVLAGVGNNAGDGYVVARLARADGLQVELLQLGDAARLRGDAHTVAERYRGAGGCVAAFSAAALQQAEVVVDAVFGTGLDRPVEGAWREAVAAVNAAGAPVLALDVPSGLHAGTGAVLGVAVRAAVTVTFIGHKTGLQTGEAAAYRGALVLEDLGVPAEVYAQVPAQARLLGPAQLREALPPRRATAHKGDYGHVLVVGGELGMGGAVRMAAEAAMRVGAGLVSVATRPEHLAATLVARPELMCHGVAAAQELDPLLERATVVVVGPGLGRGAWGRSLLARVLAASLPLVIDADGLNLLVEEPVRRDDWVLTPHPGEAGRLLGTGAGAVQVDRYGAAEAIASRYGGVCVLKGAGTLVQADGGTPAVCAAGNPGMASGGMGDVLSGVVGGLLAQGLPPARAAEVGVLVHAGAGDAAARDGQRGLLASDLLPWLRTLVNPHE